MSSDHSDLVRPCLVAGQPVTAAGELSVFNPYTKAQVGKVGLASRADLERAIETAVGYTCELSRYERSQILIRTGEVIANRREDFARGITDETGLCMRESRYEVGRALDVLSFAAGAALEDEGETFSCDISPNGKQRKIFTLREPLSVVAAITPFNHPLNTVIHKLAPAVAVGSPVILKPSEKTPLTSFRLADALYEAGLPSPMLSVLLGETDAVSVPLVTDERTSLVSFTGSVAVGKRIAATAGYKKLVLELGGNDPLIVLANGDLSLAVKLATEGAFRNSGQRCTAVKRILVEDSVLAEFTERLVAKVSEYPCGDPYDDDTRVGTVIDEDSARYLETVVSEAVTGGARVLAGGKREGALMEPTVIDQVPRDARMVVQESFGPLAPIMAVRDLDDAIAVANSTAYGLSSGVVTESLPDAIKAIKSLRTGTVNINEVPGYRIEKSPFGGIKDSGLGIKEGVLEAMRCMTTVKTYSLPW